MATITFLTPGNAKNGEDGVTKILSEKGRAQAIARGENFDIGFDKVIILPPTTLGRQTAELICHGDEQDNIVEILVWSPAKSVILEDALARLELQPLAVYLADSEIVANDTLAYGLDCWEKIMAEATRLNSDGFGRIENDSQFLVITEAVFINAIGFAVLMEDSDNKDAGDLAAILHAGTGECLGFSIDVYENGIDYLDYHCLNLTLIKDENLA